MKMTYLSQLSAKRSDRGFTMVELAIVLVIAGLILVAVLKGTDSINKAKVERAVADLKGLQGMVLEHQKRINRLPGDCDGDGVIELAADLNRTFLNQAAAPAVGALNRDERNPQALAVCNQTPPPVLSTTNDANGVAGTSNDAANLVWNEMRRSGVVDGHRTNLELAKHSNQDVFLVNAMRVTAGTTDTRANVIVMYGIPVWMAEAIDAEIDGVQQDFGGASATAGPACNGRIRRWDGNMTAAAGNVPTFACARQQYNDSAAAADRLLNRDDLVSIMYQFDTVKVIN